MSRYVDQITSQHRRPKFEATVDAVTAPLVAIQDVQEELRRGFDLDSAVGVQLDQVGEWVGRTRRLQTPLEGVYFAWDTPGVGWQEGAWRGLFDPASGMVSLPDDVYRTLLRAKVAANVWDGTRDGAYDIWESVFTDQVILIQDHQDMSIGIGIAGAPLSVVLEALLVRGLIPLKPQGVAVRYFAVPPVDAGGALFAWDCDSPALQGWGDGAWPRILTPESADAP